MLIRFAVDNVYSFGEEREFNMLPQPRLRTLEHHKYSTGGLDLVKLGAIYGSNGAGKSNLVKAIALLQEIVIGKTIPYKMEKARFRLRDPEPHHRQLLAIQFIQDGVPFSYGLEITDLAVSGEELYVSGLGKKEDQLIFERKTDPEGKPQLRFKEKFEADPESQLLKQVILKNLMKPNETILKMLGELRSVHLPEILLAVEWFEKSLFVVSPVMKPRLLAQLLDEDRAFKNYAEGILTSFNLGITEIQIEKNTIKEDGDESGAYDRLMKRIEESPSKMVVSHSKDAGYVVQKLEGDEVVAKKIKLMHSANGGGEKLFELGEESDGTNRLLDFIPLLIELISNRVVIVIDEIERSLHPNLVKEIVAKFSEDKESQGQLIFTTHESNLLDQGILRQDEIWFAEKDERGCTDLYPLSDFKEHNTIDIRKGYLQGRYGSVPFLGNFRDLNWHRDAAQV
jgi:uncharacterized protein